MMQWSNLTKCGLFSNIFSPAVHIFSFLGMMGVAALGLRWYRRFHPDPRKSPTADNDLIIGPLLLPSQVSFFMFGNRK